LNPSGGESKATSIYWANSDINSLHRRPAQICVLE
jgi:hypothetical protein